MKIKPCLTALLAASCVALTACGGDSGSGTSSLSEAPAQSSRSHLLAADSGQLAPAATAGEQDQAAKTLTLKDPGADALWHSDETSPEQGKTSAKEYVKAWNSLYGDVNPNATVQFQMPGSDEVEGVYVTLSHPSYDEKSNTITFQARLLNHTLDQAAVTALDLRNITVNVLNNLKDEQEVAAYVQYASHADLQPTSNPDQYKLVMNNVGPDMFWADNAPGKYSDARPTSYFIPQWPYMFGDNPPKAALAGLTASGEPKLHFLTLADPEYDEPSKQLTYTATRRDQAFGAMEAMQKAVLRVDAASDTRFPMPGKGTGYQAFGGDYNPSTANTTYIYFGSDIARKQTGSLWGQQSYLSQPCGSNCRNDLQRIKDMGINLIRLYDWDTRNDHSQFLNHADALHIKVIVPISNWLPTQGPDVWNQQVPQYFSARNFGNGAGTDWHPAIAGVIISNELDMEHGGQYYGNAIGLVARFIQEADTRGFSKNIRVGVPVSFVPRGDPKGPQGQNMPGWNQFQQLLTDTRTAQYKDRLMLCPQTYNSGDYLFQNAEGTGQGWVPLTYQQFGVPILFTEIGYSRSKGPEAPAFVLNQLQSAIGYQKSHPEQLLGVAHFQFDDKVWKQTPDDSDSEGAFGTYHHGNAVLTIPTVQADYDFYIDEAKGNYGVLTIDQLQPTSLHDPVVQAFK